MVTLGEKSKKKFRVEPNEVGKKEKIICTKNLHVIKCMHICKLHI